MPGANLMMGATLGLPEVANGFKKAPKEAKLAKSKANQYDAILGNSDNTIPKIAELIDAMMEKEAEDQKDETNYLKSYLIPAALIGATIARGKQTGNYMQFPKYDLGHLVKRVIPRQIDRGVERMAKKPGKYQFVAEGVAQANKDLRKNGGGAGNAASGLTGAIIGGLGFTGGSLAAQYGYEKVKEKEDVKRYKKASAELDYEKVAKDISFTPLNYIKKLGREGILQPSLQALPIYATPAVVSYALNKDIKTDFSPVRNLTKEEQEAADKKLHSSQTDFGSRNNAVLNTTLLKSASVKDIAQKWMKKPKNTSASKQNWDEYFAGKSSFTNTDKNKQYWDDYFANKSDQKTTHKKIYVKEWPEFLQNDLPIAGLRSASLALPLTYLATSDPIQQMKSKRQQDELIKQQKQQERQQQKIIKNTVKKEVQKAVEINGLA